MQINHEHILTAGFLVNIQKSLLPERLGVLGE
jgi:hypothetical protein